MNVDSLNSLPADAARAALLRCCGSQRWADAMIAHRPFASADDVYRAADEIWASLDRADWLQAFDGHPKIGDLDSLRRKFASTADWASGEQAGVAGAGDDIITSLAEGNRDYEARFGYIFIVCATGKTAAEMLTILRDRLNNDADSELRIAAAEQAKITRLRLEKL
jgi:2-oxo-4-hydroxy-4-carboxy-5-ureidoimidazoline decarboxylase